MSAISEINDTVRGLCKKAQGIMPPIHKPEVYRKAGDNILKAPSAMAGAVIGAGKAFYDLVNTYPDLIATQAFGVPKSISTNTAKDVADTMSTGVRVGAKTGWNEAGRVYSDLANTGAMVANDFGVLPDSKLNKINKWNDSEIIESMRRYGVPMPDELPKDPATGLLVPTEDPKYSQYDQFINWARGGQTTARFAFDAAAADVAGGTAGKVLTKAIGGGAKAQAAARIAGNAAVDIPAAYFMDRSDRKLKDKREYLTWLDFLEDSNPDHPDYKKIYDAAKAHRHLAPEAFDAIEPPAGPNPPAQNQASAAQQGWTMSPNLRNGLMYGAGGAGIGALLGLLFGGKGATWKWALMGSLLAGMHGGGVTNDIVNMMRGLWKK